jgi:16S rRNA (guanine527-N7)-methyltransferase
LRRKIATRVSAAGLALAPSACSQMAAFLSLLVRWNRVYNLTGISRVDDLIERFVVASLLLRKHLHGTRIADLGSGAGVPGVPLAIAEPDRQFSLIESRAKRARFLTHVVGSLSLSNVRVEHTRAEDLPTGAAFDTVLARAVGSPAEVLEIAKGLIVPGGVLVVPTSSDRREAFRRGSDTFELRATESGAEREGVVLVLDRKAS